MPQFSNSYPQKLFYFSRHNPSYLPDIPEYSHNSRCRNYFRPHLCHYHNFCQPHLNTNPPPQTIWQSKLDCFPTRSSLYPLPYYSTRLRDKDNNVPIPKYRNLSIPIYPRQTIRLRLTPQHKHEIAYNHIKHSGPPQTFSRILAAKLATSIENLKQTLGTREYKP